MSRGEPDPSGLHAGDMLSGRYRLDDLLAESRHGRFWRAHDTVLARHVAVHVIAKEDPRGDALLTAARRSAAVTDRRLLRVLDADCREEVCFVVNEWGRGTSLDILLAGDGPLEPQHAAWLTAEVAEAVAAAHEAGVAHGRLVPENVLLDHHRQVRIVGLGTDAALHGLPPGSVDDDLADLAGILYAALTGRWAGPSASAVPAAPHSHGQLMRPRQVRAGIPRALDQVCRTLLETDGGPGHPPPGRDHDLTTARGVAAALRELVLSPPPPAPSGEETPTEHVTLPPWDPAPAEAATPRAPDRPDEPDEPPTEPPTEPVREAAPAPVPEDVPTQAGVPIFHDDDDVSWLQRRSERPPPPPAFDDPPERPLFAPEPAEGEPVRRSRPGVETAPASSGSSSGPASVSTSAGSTTTGGGAGTGPVPPVPVAAPGSDNDAGRTFTRLGVVLAVALLLVIGALVAHTLGQGSPDDDTTEGTTTTTPEPSATPTLVRGTSADDFDPQGEPPQEEYPDLAPNAVDGDPSTSWRTATYRQQFGPAGLKTGVGLVVDLGRTADVAQVDVGVLGPTGFDVFVTSQRPSLEAGLDGLVAVGSGSGQGTVSVPLETPTTGRFVTVWLTSLPETSDGFRGQVSEIEVRAR